MHLRFTIREILLVTLIVALGAGWWVDRRIQARSYSAHLREVADNFRDAHQDAVDFAYFGVANGKLLWQKDPELYGRMTDRMRIWNTFRAEMENRTNFPEDAELKRPPND